MPGPIVISERIASLAQIFSRSHLPNADPSCDDGRPAHYAAQPNPNELICPSRLPCVLEFNPSTYMQVWIPMLNRIRQFWHIFASQSSCSYTTSRSPVQLWAGRLTLFFNYFDRDYEFIMTASDRSKSRNGRRQIDRFFHLQAEHRKCRAVHDWTLSVVHFCCYIIRRFARVATTWSVFFRASCRLCKLVGFLFSVLPCLTLYWWLVSLFFSLLACKVRVRVLVQHHCFVLDLTMLQCPSSHSAEILRTYSIALCGLPPSLNSCFFTIHSIPPTYLSIRSSTFISTSPGASLRITMQSAHYFFCR